MKPQMMGQPGSARLPIAGQAGTAFDALKTHPAAIAAAAQPRQNPVNANAPPMAEGKR